MRTPDQNFVDAIEAFLYRHSRNLPPLPREKTFFDRIRHCTSVPRARTANDYPNLVESLDTAWDVATIWPRAAEITRRRREHAIWQLDAIRMMRKDQPVFPGTGGYLDQCERMYAAQAAEREPEEIIGLEYVRRDDLRVADLGRERRSAGPTLFVREVSLAMREIFGKPYDKVVGELAGLAFEIKALPPETVRSMRTMRRKTGVTRQK